MYRIMCKFLLFYYYVTSAKTFLSYDGFVFKNEIAVDKKLVVFLYMPKMVKYIFTQKFMTNSCIQFSFE